MTAGPHPLDLANRLVIAPDFEGYREFRNYRIAIGEIPAPDDSDSPGRIIMFPLDDAARERLGRIRDAILAAMPRWRPPQAPAWSPTTGIGTTIRAPRKPSPEPSRHLRMVGKGALCGTVNATFTASPLSRQLCERCLRRAALDVIARREAGVEPKWPVEIEEQLLHRLRRLDRVRHAARVARRDP